MYTVRKLEDKDFEEASRLIFKTFYKYIMPLIKGESYPEYSNGLPIHFII